MPIAAVPDYVGDDFSSASPGLRFGMYLKLWGLNSRTRAKLWKTYDEKYRQSGQGREERLIKEENKNQALRHATSLTADDVMRMKSLAERQAALRATVRSEAMLHLSATAIAPFATGLGNEHPLENGFAFLNPYGLPYLPGSGVKGVLRQAARELAGRSWGDPRRWAEDRAYQCPLDGKVIALSMRDVLFGPETQEAESEDLRGVLSFWDVIPQLPGDRLQVEVMTPHQTHYYQNGESPHDSGQPNPIFFLTVPPGSRFEFHVVCDVPALQRLARELAESDKWRELLQAAFEHAFDWLGFGAKTAVGYGAMRPVPAATAATTDTGTGRATESSRGPTEVRSRREDWVNAKLVWHNGRQELKAVAQNKKSTAPVKGLEKAKSLFADEQMFEKLMKRGELPAKVTVSIQGNLIELISVLLAASPRT
jgi:CRISPR-associated protein Cmr6